MNVNLSRDLFRHRGELRRALRQRDWSITAGGNILIPSMGNAEIKPLGVFDIAINDGPRDFSDNRLPTEALNWLQSIMWKNSTPVPTWYVGLFTGNVTPGATLTGETFNSVCTEFVGYDEATRVQFVDGTVAAGAINNHSSRAVFTVSTGITATVRGAALLQASAKSDATAGQKIGAASRFAADKPVTATDILSVGYGITFTSS